MMVRRRWRAHQGKGWVTFVGDVGGWRLALVAPEGQSRYAARLRRKDGVTYVYTPGLVTLGELTSVLLSLVGPDGDIRWDAVRPPAWELELGEAVSP